MIRLLTTLFLIVTCISLISQANAAAWPDNWLGPPDNSYRSLRVKVFYYGAVIHDLPDSEGNPALPENGTDWLISLSKKSDQTSDARNSELERVKVEMEEASRFFWRNTRFNLALDLDWEIDSDPRLRSSIASTEAPYYSPVDHPAYSDMRNEYDGLVQIMVMYRHNKVTGELERVRGGGGFTWGLDAETGECGWSWWAACTEDNACGSDWLMVHEFGHQIDSMFEQSGHPEFWFNHLAPLEGNVARFGEHFDANSYILRRVPEADWHDLKWGEMLMFNDQDDDDVPDSDDYLLSLNLETDPDPASFDTDGDGLSDFAEFMATNGNRNGHGERLHPGCWSINEIDPDPDFDGLTDGTDPYPFIFGLSSIPHYSESTEFLPASMVAGMSGSYNNIWPFECRLSYSGNTDWENEPVDDNSLSIDILPWTYAEAELIEFKLMLDLDNDGWFTGTDNYQIMIENGRVSKLIQHQAGSNTEWPQAVELDHSAHGLELTGYTDKQIDRTVKLKLDQQYFPELAAKPGEMIGFNIGIRTAGEAWFYMLAEPNTLVPLELR